MDQTKNPFTKKHFNMDNQAIIYKQDPALFDKLKAEAIHLDAEEERKRRTRTLAEFNEMDIAGKVKFIQNNGEVI
jgi:hypothetical protein